MTKNVIFCIGLSLLATGTVVGQKSLRILSAQEDLGFLRPQVFPLQKSLGTVNATHLIDLNDNGRLDLMIGASEGLFIRWGGASPSGFGENVSVPICEGREVLKIHDSGCGSGLVWVECAETRRAMLLDFQKDGRCEVLHEVDGVENQLLGAGGGLFWYRPDEQGVIQAFRWDVNLGQAVSFSAIDATSSLESIVIRDFDGDGLVDLAGADPERGVGVWWHGATELDWVPGTGDVRHWAFVHASGEPPQIAAVDFESRRPKRWTRVDSNPWEKETIEANDRDDHLMSHPDNEFFSGLDHQGRRVLMRHSLVTQAMDCLVRNQEDWIGYNAMGASDHVHSFQILDISGDNQSDLVFFEGSTNSVWVVQQHLPGALAPIGIDMGCGFGPQEWFASDIEPSAVWTRPFWDAAPKSYRMHLQEAMSESSEAVQQVLHHTGRVFVVKDSSFLELMASEKLVDWHPDELIAWPTDPDEPRLSDEGVLGVYVPSARMKFVTSGKIGFSHAETVPLNEWSHWVYTRDKNLRVKNYLNGELILSAAGADVPYDHRNLILGAAYGRGWHDHYNGSVDEVEVIHRVLTAEEVRRRWENRKAETSDWTICLVSFDENLDKDTVPRNEVNNAMFRTYGDWAYTEGVHGRGLRFDGKTGSMRVSADIPEVDVTYSFWFRPETAIEEGAGQVLVSGYGMYNSNFRLLNPPASVPQAEALELFEVKEVQAPEPGRLFLHNATRFWFGKSLQLHQVKNGVWEKINCKGSAPVKVMKWGAMWEVDGVIHMVNQENGQIHSLDLNTFEWKEGERLPASVATCTIAASSQSGQAFANFDTRVAWWWPKASQEIYPLAFPSDVLTPGDEWSGFSMALGAIALSSREGVKMPVVLDPLQEPLAIGFRGGEQKWIGVPLGAIACLFLLLLFRRKKQKQRVNLPSQPQANVRSEEVLEAVEKLKQSGAEILDSAGLDELLGLTYMESEETRRSHRARLVKEINAWSAMERSRKAILREKDPLDRRRMLYRLDLHD